MNGSISFYLKINNIMKHISSIITVVFLSIIIFLSSCSNKELKTYENVDKMLIDAKSNITSISIDEFKKIFDSEEEYYLIDVREENEYSISCIPGAINIPRGLLEFKIGNEIDNRRAKIYLYCDNGERSSLAVNSLPELKFPNAILIESGFDAWKGKYYKDVELSPAGDTEERDTPPPSGGGCGG